MNTDDRRRIHNMKRHQHQHVGDDEVFDNDDEQLQYDNQEDELRVQHEYEYNFYRRFIIFIIILFVFWVVVLVLDEHHDYALMIAALVVFGLWFVYIFTCICCNICYLCQNSSSGGDRRGGGGRMEQSGLTSSVYFDDGDDEDDDDDENDDNFSFQYPMKDTLQRIQEASLLQTIKPGKGPTNGTYLGVFSAVYFNKTLRTEGKFELEFIPTTNDALSDSSSSKYNGWIIQGYSYFGGSSNDDNSSSNATSNNKTTTIKRKRPIQNGFINPKGHMYWETNATSHRGKLNFDTSCMFDGEFSANLDNTDDRFPHLKTDGSSSNKQPMGRIVRFEISKAQFYTSHLTGTSIISPTALSAEHKKKKTNQKSQLRSDDNNHNEMEMVTFSSSPEEELQQQQHQQQQPQPDLLV